MTLQKTPCTCLNFSLRSLTRNRAGALGKTPIPATGWLAGGEGGVEEHEGGEGYLVVCSVGVGGDRRGASGGNSERRRSARREAALRRGRAAVGRPVSTSRSRATYSEGRL